MVNQIVIILAGLLLFVSACGKRAVIRQHYIIEVPVEVDSTLLSKQPLSNEYCEILPIKVRPAYAKKRIAVRTGSHELAYYFYHEWAVRPENAFMNLVESYLQNQRFFAGVASHLWRQNPRYQLSVNVYQLEAIQERQRLLAHLHMDFILQDIVSRETVVFHTCDERRPLRERKINLLAETVSEILETELQKFGDKIRNYLREVPQAMPSTEEQL